MTSECQENTLQYSCCVHHIHTKVHIIMYDEMIQNGTENEIIHNPAVQWLMLIIFCELYPKS